VSLGTNIQLSEKLRSETLKTMLSQLALAAVNSITSSVILTAVCTKMLERY